MVSLNFLKFILPATALVLAQGIEGFCIYNSISDGSAFDVTQTGNKTPDPK
jgi:hypothetical protein